MTSKVLSAGWVAATVTVLNMSAVAQSPPPGGPPPGAPPPGALPGGPPPGGPNAIFIPPPSADAPPPSTDPRNFEGMYFGAPLNFSAGGPGGAEYTAAAQARTDKRRQLMAQGQEEPPPSFYCRPYANVNAVAEPIFPTKVIQTRNRLVFLPEEGGGYWEIHIDSEHPSGKALVPTYNGDSIGHWEGDTLVVDVIGFNGKLWLDNAGPQSTKTHITAWIKKIDGGRKLEMKYQVDDPATYLKPVMHTAALQWNPELSLGEFACEESIGVGAYPAQRAAGFSKD